MTVAKFTQPDMTTQDATSYKANIDGAISVLEQMGAGFAPRAQDTPDMTVRVDPGALYDRVAGGFNTAAGQNTAVIVAPGAGTSKIVRVYVTEAGVIGKVEGTAAASPIAPTYPAGCFPVCQVTITNATTSIMNSMITDERAFNTGYGVPKNTFLVTTSRTFQKPANAKFYRITGAGPGGGAGGGASAAADATKYAGGGAGGGASVIGRLFSAEDLTIVIGAKGIGGASAATAAVAASAGTTGGVTTITGNTSGNVISLAAGVLGGGATAAANGALGAGGAAGTGIAGVAGTAGTAGTKGGDGGGVGPSGTLSPGGKGAVLATTRTGSDGKRGSGGGGGIGFQAGAKGGDGGESFVLVEVF